MSNSMLIMLAGLLGEIVLLALVLLTIAYLRNRAQRKADLKAVKTLIARIKNGKAEREKTIEQFLEQGMGLSGEALQQAKLTTLRAELGMLRRVAGVYRLREAAALARIDDDLFAAVGPYHALTAVATEATTSDAGPVDEDELEQLRKENQRLSEELTITMETMGRMLNEYSSMFAGGSPDVAASTAATAAATETPGDEEVMIASVGGNDQPAAADDGQAAAVDSTAEVAARDEVDRADVPDEVEIAAAVDMDAVPDASMAEEAFAGVVEAGVEQPPEVDEDEPLDAAADEDDEIAAILREAQSQELSARSGTESDDDGAVDVTVAEQAPQAADQDAAAETAVVMNDDVDDLFDAAGDDFADVIADGGAQGVDAPAEGEPPLTSQGGS